MDEVVVLQATWQSGSLLPCVELIAPDDSRQTACANSWWNRIDAQLDQTGIFSILITDYFGTSTGEYAVTLQCLSGCVKPPPICEGDFDEDGDVDGDDLYIFAEDLGRTDCP